MHPARRNTDALAWSAAAFCAIAALPSARPEATPLYLLLSAGVAAGALIGVRLAPGRLPTSLVLLPATVAGMRMGDASVPAVLYATLLAGLARGGALVDAAQRAGAEALVFVAALLATRYVDWDGPLHVVLFAATYAVLRTGVAIVHRRVMGEPGLHELSDLPMLLLLGPLAVVPLLAGGMLGDGGLVLALAAMLLVLLVVQDAVNLATARIEVEHDRDRLARAYALQEDVVNLVTHDVNNALTAVMAYSQLERRAIKSGALDKAAEYLDRVERGGATIQRLTLTLLKLARMDQSDSLPPAVPVPVAPILEQALAEHAPAARDRRQTLTLEPSSDQIAAMAQPDLLGEAVSNLVGNAIKYTPDEGIVRLRAQRDRGRVVVAVTDSGIGMDSEDVGRLFSRFFRSSDPAARDQPGVGLGLALVRSMVERMGGEVRVASARGRGTTFEIVLPAG